MGNAKALDAGQEWNYTSVFDRKFTGTQAKDEIEPARYNLIIGLVLLWGFGINLLLVQLVPVELLLGIDFRLFLIVYFASCVYGSHLFTTSTVPWVSFAGYNFVVVPFGLVVNIVTSRYAPAIVFDALRITAIVTLVMMLFGTYFPDFFERIERALFVAFLSVVILEVIETFVFGIHHDLFDWIVALLMCGYIGYDWGRASRIPKTVDNAVDSAATLYMDIVILFLKILRILGKNRR